MVRALHHRGPDGHGALVEGPIGLGHARLSIIDLAGGAQPLGNEDGQVQVVFNGEFVVGNQWINPTNLYYQQSFPVPKRDVVKAKALLKEAPALASA